MRTPSIIRSTAPLLKCPGWFTRLVALCLLAACARPDHLESWVDRLAISAGPQPGYAIKRVVEKQRPATLLGDDGSLCRTSVRRFSATAVGAWISCDWKLPAGDEAELAAARPS